MSVLKTPDGVSLRAVRWPPPPGRKGTVCIFQGRAEFLEKYFETVRELHTRGFAVATMDWRGQGLSDRALSDRRKGHITNFSQYDTDLSTFMKDVVLPDCPPPYFALAHSMGSAPLMRAAQLGERWFDRMVFTVTADRACPNAVWQPLEAARPHSQNSGLRYDVRSRRTEDHYRCCAVCRKHRDVGSGALRAQRRSSAG